MKPVSHKQIGLPSEFWKHCPPFRQKFSSLQGFSARTNINYITTPSPNTIFSKKSYKKEKLAESYNSKMINYSLRQCRHHFPRRSPSGWNGSERSGIERRQFAAVDSSSHSEIAHATLVRRWICDAEDSLLPPGSTLLDCGCPPLAKGSWTEITEVVWVWITG